MLLSWLLGVALVMWIVRLIAPGRPGLSASTVGQREWRPAGPTSEYSQGLRPLRDQVCQTVFAADRFCSCFLAPRVRMKTTSSTSPTTTTTMLPRPARAVKEPGAG